MPDRHFVETDVDDVDSLMKVDHPKVSGDDMKLPKHESDSPEVRRTEKNERGQSAQYNSNCQCISVHFGAFHESFLFFILLLRLNRR